MNHNEVIHSSPVNVPFSWENSPGICKKANNHMIMRDQCLMGTSTAGVHDDDEKALQLVVPPPPCSTKHPIVLAQDPKIPGHQLAPFSKFLSPLRSIKVSRKIRVESDQDPFLAAYMECTKNVADDHQAKFTKLDAGHTDDHIGGGNWRRRSAGLMNNISMFSCKQYSCTEVREDSLVSMARRPSLPAQFYRRSSSETSKTGGSFRTTSDPWLN